MPQELFTVSYLTTQAGMVAAVMILVFFAKWLLGIEGKTARIVAFICAMIVVAAAMLFRGEIPPGLEVAAIIQVVLLWALNTVFITLVAMGAYEIKKGVVGSKT